MRRLLSSLLSGALWLALVCVLTHCGARSSRSAPESSPATLKPATQPETPAQREPITRPVSEPYTGDLAIFEDPQRGRKLQINRVMDLLGIKQGGNVADIGAGSGWFTLRAARRVGAGGIVYAVEINPSFLKHIEARARRARLPNIRAVLGAADDPRLPPQSLDAALILNTYHEVAQPIRLLERLHIALRPTARLGIIDRNGKGDDHGLSSQTVLEEAARAGFSLVAQYDFVKPGDMDYFLVLRP